VSLFLQAHVEISEEQAAFVFEPEDTDRLYSKTSASVYRTAGVNPEDNILKKLTGKVTSGK
jgi:hypothetical protein